MLLAPHVGYLNLVPSHVVLKLGEHLELVIHGLPVNGSDDVPRPQAGRLSAHPVNNPSQDNAGLGVYPFLRHALRVEPHPTLKLGLSAYRDVQNVYDSEGAETDDHVTNAAFGASLEWSLREVSVELEGVRGWIPSGGTARTETLGLSALLSRRFGAHATPYLAAQYLDPDQDVSDDAALLFIAGVNVRVSSNLFLKAEIDRYSSQDANPRFKGVGFTQANAAIVVGF